MWGDFIPYSYGSIRKRKFKFRWSLVATALGTMDSGCHSAGNGLTREIEGYGVAGSQPGSMWKQFIKFHISTALKPNFHCLNMHLRWRVDEVELCTIISITTYNRYEAGWWWRYHKIEIILLPEARSRRHRSWVGFSNVTVLDIRRWRKPKANLLPIVFLFKFAQTAHHTKSSAIAKTTEISNCLPEPKGICITIHTRIHLL